MGVVFFAASLAKDVAGYLYDHIVYDYSEIVRIDGISFRSDVLAPGESFGYRLDQYYKRADCGPPEGYGNLRYRVYDLNVDRLPNRVANWVWLDYERRSRAPGGETVQSLGDFSEIPLPVLKPGLYALQWEASYYCARSKEPNQVRDGPLMKFTVAGA